MSIFSNICLVLLNSVLSNSLSGMLKRFWIAKLQLRERIIKQTLDKVGSYDLYNALALGMMHPKLLEFVLTFNQYKSNHLWYSFLEGKCIYWFLTEK